MPQIISNITTTFLSSCYCLISWDILYFLMQIVAKQVYGLSCCWVLLSLSCILCSSVSSLDWSFLRPNLVSKHLNLQIKKYLEQDIV